DPQHGCAVRVKLGGPTEPGPEPGSVTLYLQSSEADSVYTPYSFSFCAGALDTAFPMRCHTCDEVFSGPQRSQFPLCSPTPNGEWHFRLTTLGAPSAGDPQGKAGECPIGVDCDNMRAAASLFIDGMWLAATSGSYTSRAFDSLSPLTRWRSICWETTLNVQPPIGMPRTPVDLFWSAYDAAPAVFVKREPTIAETGCDGLVDAPAEKRVGRYFRWAAGLTGWDENGASLPPDKSTLGGLPNDYCVRYSPAYDGALTPVVRSVKVVYEAYAGRFVTQLIKPARMKRWKMLSYDVDLAGGSVQADVGLVNPATGAFEPVADLRGTVLTAQPSGTTLYLNPGQYPALQLRFTLHRGAGQAASPCVRRLEVGYEPMDECLALSRNVIRQSRREGLDIRYCVEAPGPVTISIHDWAGQLVWKKSPNENPIAPEEPQLPGGVYQMHWDGTAANGAPVAPGLYFVTVVTSTATVTKKVAVGR
ncbi:MAG: hypothetical protein AAB368_01765, partial [bacterium]